jgi:hypothetical protein
MKLETKNYSYGGNMEIRKLVTIVEEIRSEMGKTLQKPIRRSAAVAIIKNPFAGMYQEDLSQLINIGEELGLLLAPIALDGLKLAPNEEVDSYGKAAIVGTDGEIEHAAAILHPKLGKPFRDAIGGGKSIIPSSNKIGTAGTEFDVPLGYKDAAFVRTHYDAMPICIQDAPRPDEIGVALVVTNGGRPLPRIGGLKKEEAKKEDGLR